MLAKTNHWISISGAVLFVVLLAAVSLAVDVSAAPSNGETFNSCLSCHEGLYYLYDSGQHCCLTDHKDRCTDCHEGNETVMDEELGHLGLIAHPQENDGAKCKECHADDSQAQIDAFASGIGGFTRVMKAEAYVPSATVDAEFPAIADENQSVRTWAWAAGSVVLFGSWLALVLLSPQRP